MKNCHENNRPKGFALVVTLSLMILLTVIAVGLLSLSAVSLRSSSQGMAQAEAKANARLALMMALGELQKTVGPDRRVTAPANLVKPTHLSTLSTLQGTAYTGNSSMTQKAQAGSRHAPIAKPSSNAFRSISTLRKPRMPVHWCRPICFLAASS